MSSHSKKVATLAAAVTLAAVTAACGSDDATGAGAGDGDGAATVKLMMFPNQALRLPAVVAQEEGMFKDKSLSVEFAEFPATLGAFQALDATGSQFTQISDASVLESWQAGAEFQIACGQQSRQLISVMAPADTPLKSVDDGGDWRDVLAQLDGKVLGTPAPPGTGFIKGIETLLKEAKVDPKNVTFVNIGAATPQVDAAIKNGQVDAAITFPTGTQYLKENGTAKELMYLPETDSAYGALHFATWVGQPKWMDDHPDEVKAFCDAVTTATDFIQDDSNADAVVRMMMKDMQLPEPVAKRVLDDGVYDTYSTEQLTKDEWDQTVDGLIKAGLVKSSPIPTYEELFASVK